MGRAKMVGWVESQVLQQQTLSSRKYSAEMELIVHLPLGRTLWAIFLSRTAKFEQMYVLCE